MNARPRLPRFPLQLPLRYRPSGSSQWREGKTENISHSGVLFWAENLLDLNTRVEMRVILPIPASDIAPPEIICQGRVVRTVSPSDIHPQPGIAIAIETYDFLRPSP
jgi:hypothetical protein